MRPCRHRFQHIAQPPQHARHIAGPYGLYHTVNIRMDHIFLLIKFPVRPGCGNLQLRFCQHQLQRRQVRQRRQYLTPTGGQRRSARYAEGHIRPQFGAQPFQFFRRQTQFPVPVQAPQDRSGIRAAPCQSGSQKNPFFNMDMHPRLPPGKFPHQHSRFIRQVGRTSLQLLPVRGHFQFRTLRNGYGIRQTDRLHHHRDLVILIRPQSQHVQPQIDLGISCFRQFHKRFPVITASSVVLIQIRSTAFRKHKK